MRFILGARKVRGSCAEGAWEVRGRCAGGARKVRGKCNANHLIGCGGDC